jgi:outer membrane protein assembly factor BamB
VSPGGEESILYTQSLQKKPANRIPVSAAPVIDEERGVIYFIVNLDRESLLHAWQGKTGKILWSHTFPKNVLATPAIAKDGAIIAAALDGLVYSIGADQSLNYRYASGCEYLLAGAVCSESGDAFVGDPVGGVHKIAPNGTGTRLFEVERGVQSRPSLDRSGTIYIPSTDRNVYLFANQKL